MALDWAYIWRRRGNNGFGSHSTAEEVTQGIHLHTHTILITGATSGIGLETARVLAKRGAHVIIPARNIKAAEQAKSDILNEVEGARVDIATLDLSSLASVRRFVDDFSSRHQHLNILINNAGVICSGLQLSEDQLELQFATNHLGHFLLTNLLLQKMLYTSQTTGIEGRILMISSKEHAICKDDIDFSKLNDCNRASIWKPYYYGVSKLANILHAKELSRRLQEHSETKPRITVNAIHPGIVRTSMTRNLHPAIRSYLSVFSKFMRSPQQGAATTCYVATHPNLNGVSGKYFEDCSEAECSSAANDKALAANLWAFSDLCVHTNESTLS